MAAIGSLDEFQVGRIFRMEQYCIAKSVAEEKRVAVFLTAIGGATYELLRNLLSPDAPKDKSLDKLKSTLRTHLTLMIAERFKFYRRTQREGESVAEYVVALKELSTHCDFRTFLNDALRNLLLFPAALRKLMEPLKPN